MEYFLQILILINIYIIIAISLNLIAGYMGILSVAHAGFYGIGAYVTALMSVSFNSSFFFNLPVVILAAVIVAILIALPSLRIHNDFFVIATFGFQIIIFDIFNNWSSLTNGPIGISGIPKIKIFNLTIDTSFQYLIFTSILSVAIFILVKRIVNSPFGRIIKAIREDELYTQSLGKNVTHYKIIVFIISGCIAAFAGSLYAHYFHFIDPSSFTITESIFMFSIVIIGGAGRISGSVIGAILLVIIPEAFRFLDISSPIAANLRQILYGTLLIIFMMYRPQGLIGEYDFK